MISPHASRYSALQASILNPSLLGLYSFGFYFICWPKSFFGLILKILAFPLCLFYGCLVTTMLILALLGYLINFFPVVRIVYFVLFEFVFAVSEYVAYFIHCSVSRDYNDFIDDKNMEGAVEKPVG